MRADSPQRRCGYAGIQACIEDKWTVGEAGSLAGCAATPPGNSAWIRTRDLTIMSTAPYGEGGRDWSFWAKELLQTGRKYLRDDLRSVAGFFAHVDLW
jgi:hypothetical protein